MIAFAQRTTSSETDPIRFGQHAAHSRSMVFHQRVMFEIAAGTCPRRSRPDVSAPGGTLFAESMRKVQPRKMTSGS
jgi:hypothetical protein